MREYVRLRQHSVLLRCQGIHHTTRLYHDAVMMHVVDSCRGYLSRSESLGLPQRLGPPAAALLFRFRLCTEWHRDIATASGMPA